MSMFYEFKVKILKGFSSLYKRLEKGMIICLIIKNQKRDL